MMRRRAYFRRMTNASSFVVDYRARAPQKNWRWPVYALLAILGGGCRSGADGSVKRIARFPTGAVREIFWVKDGQRYGVDSVFDESGRVRSVERYRHGLMEGQQRDYYANGVLKGSQGYVHGRFDGPFKGFYPTGALKSEGLMRAGQQIGTHRQYYPNGQLQSRSVYQRNHANGPRVDYYPNGKRMLSGTCRDGQLEGVVVIHESVHGDSLRVRYVHGQPVGRAE